ncbi:VOC family protein [Oceaniglobus trochenteri]|uniref:VOC family protein n=1 Tax=Oceaniglobus trochenteri TaxID=2763260 RepID=UPI001D000CDA|nr:VOC family protein [Oceaniglobus trochenteri]
MEQRISLITLGVRDMEAQAAFFDAMGWQRVKTEDGVIAYDLPGQTLCLYPAADLARDIGVEAGAPGGFSGITLGYNVRDKSEVAAVLARVEPAGGRVLKPAGDVFWGGHHGYFADPEGHVWEVAHNPFSPLGRDGAFQWNGAS